MKEMAEKITNHACSVMKDLVEATKIQADAVNKIEDHVMRMLEDAGPIYVIIGTGRAAGVWAKLDTGSIVHYRRGCDSLNEPEFGFMARALLVKDGDLESTWPYDPLRSYAVITTTAPSPEEVNLRSKCNRIYRRKFKAARGYGVGVGYRVDDELMTEVQKSLGLDVVKFSRKDNL